MMENFLAAVTHTVIGFQPDGGLYENADTHVQLESGVVTFDCGHSYRWRPWGVKTREDIPTVGKSDMCALCIEAELVCVETTLARLSR